jgi:hypothetical protein
MRFEKNKTSAYLVYVHLGQNPSPTLLEFSFQAQSILPGSKLMLVTDHPENWQAFPGEVITYKSEKDFKGLSRFKKNHKELNSIANGYWVFTLQRLFALTNILKFVDDDTPIIHFESDVQSFITQPILELMQNELKSVHVPRFSNDAGIASTIFFRNKLQLENMLANSDDALIVDLEIKSDMELLGKLLNSGKVEELDSGRSSYFGPKILYFEYEVVFDGAGIGQYLFGQDPLHTNNRRISGFQNPDHTVNFANAEWGIDTLSGFDYVVFKYRGVKYLVASMHIHSKALLPQVSGDSKIWNRSIGEANGTLARAIGDFVPDLIHSQKISLVNRLRIARKNGLLQTLQRKLRANLK